MQSKFKIGDKVVTKDTCIIAEVVEVECNDYASRYTVHFSDGRVPHRWLMAEGNLEKVKNALQRLKERYAKSRG